MAARPWRLLGDPAAAAWLTRTALAAGRMFASEHTAAFYLRQAWRPVGVCDWRDRWPLFCARFCSPCTRCR
jgi:hypothetical protein